MRSLADHRATRIGLSAALVVIAALVVLGEAEVRRGETDLVGAFVGHVLGLTTYVNPYRPQIFVANHPNAAFQQWSGVTITAECTSTWLLGPLFLVAGLTVLGRRLTVRAVLVAAAATAILLALVNVGRIALIVLSLHVWGADGYRWSHEILGSILSVVGVCASAVLFVVIAIRLSRRGVLTGPASD